jgi:NAD(P)H-hydrate epimerase
MLDRLAIERCGVPGVLLMENAGTGCAELLVQRLEAGAWEQPAAVLAGPGNNGGDGFVVARHLHNRGFAVQVCLVGRASALRAGSDAETNWRALTGTGVPAAEVEPGDARLEEAVAGAGCFVDALFGTGLTRPLDEPFGRLFARIAGRRKPVLAVDVPSGLDAETGAVEGPAIRADVTATFAAAKPGLVTGYGPRHAGEVVVVPISIPRRLIERARRDEHAFRAWAENELARGKA